MNVEKTYELIKRSVPHVFNRFYSLHPRVEAAWHSLKSMVGDIMRNSSVQTIKAETGQKSPATTSYGQPEEATDFEPKPAKYKIFKVIKNEYYIYFWKSKKK